VNAAGPGATRCLIVDDQAMVREGFAAVLAAQPGLQVVGQAADGADAVAQARHLAPDVVLMDVRMPVMDGLAATREILRDPAKGTRVLMLTTFDLDDYVYEALRAGASGFLLKDATAAELVHAVRVVAGGEALLAPSVTRRLIADFARRPRHDPGPAPSLGALTQRETDVLRLIARGLSNAEISDTLVIAEQTTKTYVGRILAKLNLRDRAQAVVVAYETGLVTPGGSGQDRNEHHRQLFIYAVVSSPQRRRMAVSASPNTVCAAMPRIRITMMIAVRSVMSLCAW
jgi:DNA-binding NarL/FixJ family response regulator